MKNVIRDPSCIHANLATSLNDMEITSPEKALGIPPTTLASFQGEKLVFDDLLSTIISNLRLSGIAITEYNFSDGISKMLSEATHSNSYVVALLDPFYLPFCWADYQKNHGYHLCIITGYNHTDESVHIVDSSDVIDFNGSVQVSTFNESALCKDTSYRWFSISKNHHYNLRDSYSVLELEQLWSSEKYLSHHELLNHIEGNLTKIISILTKEIESKTEAFSDSDKLIQGIWTVSHVLRWHTNKVKQSIVNQDLYNNIVPLLETLSQDWLILRNNLIKVRIGSSQVLVDRIPSILSQIHHSISAIKNLVQTHA